MTSGQKTPPEVGAGVVKLVRGQTRKQVAGATSLAPWTVSRIVRDTEGLDFARSGQGASGTPEAMAKARGQRSEYMRTGREAIAARLPGQMDKGSTSSNARRTRGSARASMQGVDAAPRSYTNVTKPDAILSEQEAMRSTFSMLDGLIAQMGEKHDDAERIGDAIRRSGGD